MSGVVRRGQFGRMIAFLLILIGTTAVIAGAAWFYRERIAATDNGVGAIVVILMTVAILVFVLIGMTRLAAER